MHLIKCENNSYFNNCKSNNEIEEYLEKCFSFFNLLNKYY